jgi:alanyl-tRNA synthetase
LRAVRRSRTGFEVLAGLAAEFSAAVDELPQLVASQRAELKQAGSTVRELERSLSLHRAKELYAAAVPDATGLRRVLVREKGGSLDQLRGLAQAFASMPCAVFVAAVERPPSLLLGASADSGIHAGDVLKGILAVVGGRGGGSAGLAQGVLSDQAHLEQVITALGNSQ